MLSCVFKAFSEVFYKEHLHLIASEQFLAFELSFSVFNPLTTNVPHHIETSQLIYIANQLTGFYMMENIGHTWVNTWQSLIA